MRSSVLETYKNLLKFIISHAKSFGFIFASSEIYDGLSAVYDYGPNGVHLKNNIKNYWWYLMVKLHENISIIDTSILMHPTTWIASGHVKYFNEFFIENKESLCSYRVEALIETFWQKIQEKMENYFEEYKNITNVKIVKYIEKTNYIIKKMKKLFEENNLYGIKNFLNELQILDPIYGKTNWTNVYPYNLMFTTKIGSTKKYIKSYIRPETAQGTFVNFYNVQRTTSIKIPFGIAQIGKSFRNEFIARQFLFRMREFEQMEMQFFVPPGQEMYWYKYWKETRLKWHLSLNLGNEKYRLKEHNKLSHYSNAATDIEFKFPFGFKELEGIHSRTDFDLKNHEKYSGINLRYFDTKSKKTYIPYVIETSIGLDRMFLSVFSYSLKKEKKPNGNIRIVLKIPSFLAPLKGAILPLINNDGLPDIAKKIYKVLKLDYDILYEEKESIGKRYRIQDALGTPFCFTIDHKTSENETVTVRFRDTMEQNRIHINDIPTFLKESTERKTILKKLI